MLYKSAIESINKLLHLPATGLEQDWDIEMADKDRIAEFLIVIHDNKLDNDEKYAIVALILASYDDYLKNQKDENNKVWTEIIEVLNKNRNLYNELLNYWALWHMSADENWFNITSLVRLYISNYLSTKH